MTDQPAIICTCPSGDGSLSHPCPAHVNDCASGAINLIDAMLANSALPLKSKARLRTVRDIVVSLLERANRDRSFDFVAHLERQRRFSAHTFGPGARAAGIVDHIRKELLEIEAEPGDLREWIDVVILALDGACRTGATPQEVSAAIVAKQTKNESRVWPHWSTMPADKAIEHDRAGETTSVIPSREASMVVIKCNEDGTPAGASQRSPGSEVGSAQGASRTRTHLATARPTQSAGFP